MEFTLASESTSLSYWLRWEFFFCLLSVFTSVIIASFLIRKYEGWDNTERAFSVHDGEAWMPCLKGLSPVWLLVFRIIAICLLLAASISDVATHGTNLFYYYTQWTLILTIIYFLFGSLLSACGCFRKHEICNTLRKELNTDTEKGIYAPLTHAGADKAVNQLGECYFWQTGAVWGYVFQIVYQVFLKSTPHIIRKYHPFLLIIILYIFCTLITAGAVMLTDGVYWLLTVVVHSLNIVLLLGDTTMNSLHFPWFRISYFILFTALYVSFEWIVHTIVETWWPYPFLDVSVEFASTWWVVAVFHYICALCEVHYIVSVVS